MSISNFEEVKDFRKSIFSLAELLGSIPEQFHKATVISAII